MHRLDLGLYSHPKEFWGKWSLNPCQLQRKNPLYRKISPEEDQTRDAVDSEPKHYQRAIPAPHSYLKHLGLSHTPDCPCETDPQTPQHILRDGNGGKSKILKLLTKQTSFLVQPYVRLARITSQYFTSLFLPAVILLSSLHKTHVCVRHKAIFKQYASEPTRDTLHWYKMADVIAAGVHSVSNSRL